jgi:hypothetical protein
VVVGSAKIDLQRPFERCAELCDRVLDVLTCRFSFAVSSVCFAGSSDLSMGDSWAAWGVLIIG